jgi:hypothetical protein
MGRSSCAYVGTQKIAAIQGKGKVQLHLTVRVVVFKEFTNGRIQQNKRVPDTKTILLRKLPFTCESSNG